MSKRNPIERSQYINNQYKEYLRSSFEFKTPKLQKLFEQQLEVEDLFKGPYVDLNLPFQRGMSLDEMIADGAVCKSFHRLGDMNFERPLYSHQEESIRHICSGRSAIITTGTGSGKTESFLYPILNELMSDVENGNREVGVRAIFLYPMNALVNDQIDRVRKILTQCPEITYGFFTGETKESIPKDYREKYGAENDTFIPENELVSREEIRKNPPHLLFTNYSMLEYLLIRPNDYSIFAPERLNNWKFVVLDEAHSYYGSLGIELSLLMRRLTGLAPKKPRFILTSATLGEQGKSESEIVNFARSLTSASFDIQDIIFSKRITLSNSKLSYTIAGEDYSEIKKAKHDIQTVRTIGNKYKNIDSMELKSYLYELFVGDRNVFHLYEVLKDGSKSFKSILANFNNQIMSEQLIDLIDLINMAEKDGIGIFDLKYHSFVRPLAGAYVTLGDDPQLSLTKTNMIGELKAFEAGNCRYCNSPYIIGKIQRNEADGLEYLYQNKEVDIYENYGNNEFVSIDYFLMSNEFNEEEVDHDILEEYKVCAKCGAIYAAGNLNARRCICGDSFQHSIFKVLQSKKDGEETAFNNINQCPCCGHKARAGVVKSLNVGKDEGTALLAQILYEAIDDGTETKKKISKISLKRKETVQSEIETSNVKQFLAFSDSRQQASFSAAFLDSNQVRMLQKRLIWKVIEDNQYRNISVDQLAATLSGMIKEGNLFQNDLSAHKNAWITILVDLLKVDGSNDGEGLGLYFFDVDITDIMSQIDEEDVEAEFGEYNITKKDLETIMQVVFGVFKVTPAINSIKSTLTPDEKMEALEYRRFDNYVMFNCPKTINGVRSFLPVKGKDNMVVRYVQKVCECDEESAKALLEVVFNNLAVAGELFKKHETKECYQIEASKYVVKNYKTSKYYICSKCGRLTPYNVHNKCVQDKCDGILSEVDPDKALASNYYRRQYKTKKIESTKESTRAKPKRSYAGEVSYLGGGIKDENIVSLSNAITIETSINDELLVMNKSSFNMCPICGYSDIVKGKVITPTSLKKHKNYRQFDCSCEELTQVRLGHRFQTDVARFTIPMLGSFTKEDYAIALSFMYAFLEGISIGLGIERNDIDGVLELNLEQHSYDILIYDNVPGGAGHVKRLVEKNAVITSLNTAYVKVSQQCCDENTSCYNCLRNYYNQTNHSKLKRKYARDFIESLLRQIGVRP